MGSDGSTGNARRIGLVTATLLVVANMIGTGVFTTTGFLVRDLESSLAVLESGRVVYARVASDPADEEVLVFDIPR